MYYAQPLPIATQTRAPSWASGCGHQSHICQGLETQNHVSRLVQSSASAGHLPIPSSLPGMTKMAVTILEPMLSSVTMSSFTTWCFSDTMLCSVALGMGR